MVCGYSKTFNMHAFNYFIYLFPFAMIISMYFIVYYEDNPNLLMIQFIL